jgi:heat shock protein HtpX
MNAVRTTLLMAALTVLLVLIGGLIGGRVGMIVALAIAAVLNFIGYWSSDKIALAMYRARPVPRDKAPELFDMVETLSKRAGIPMPRIYIIPTDSPNAFATGRDPEHAAVAVTVGALKVLKRDELMGVLGHELTHVENRDILIQSIAATLAGAITLLATWARWAAIFGGYGGSSDSRRGGGIGLLIMAIVAPLAALLIQLGISRSREYLADAGGARLAQDPNGLANALEKLSKWSKKAPLAANPSTAHMFIVSPLTGGGIAGLFSTHPPLEERVKRLRQMKP